MLHAEPPTLRLTAESAVYCISDLHLSADAPALFALFERFMQDTAADADALFVLGDLFESWLGDDDQSPLAANVIAQFQSASKRGVQLILMHGNRDFLIGSAFAAQCGAQLWPDYGLLQAGALTLRLFHGDAECTRDVGYQRARSLLRSAAWQTDFLRKTLAERRAFERDARASSMAHQANQLAHDASILDVTPAEIDALHAQFPGALLLHGHTHRPAIHQSAGGVRIVLGDWGPAASWVRIQHSELTLSARGFVHRYAAAEESAA